ncbi:MAG: pilus assembly protein PilM [Candidatus Nomurabacteria bacterium]|nr:MAG: pilus assembly protein PilM [Candidatus Nomurabacteria bacterium]
MPLPNFSNAFGLEIRDTEIRVAQIHRHGKKLSLSSYGFSQIPNGAMERGEILKSDQVKLAILNALKSPVGKNFSSQYVVCAIPEQHVFTTVITLPAKKSIEKDDVQAAALQQIPYPLEDIQLDWTLVDKDAKTNYILVGAAPKNIIAAYTQVLRSANLIPVALEPQSSSIARALLTSHDAQTPTMVLHFGQKLLTIFIVNKNVVYFSSSTPIFSGESIISLLSKKLDLNADKARKAAQLFGLQAKEGKGEVRRALLPEISALMEHIEQIKEYSSSHLPAPVHNISTMLVTGEMSSLPGLAEYLQEELRIPIQPGLPGERYQLEIPQKELTSLDLQSSATVLGLALHELA